MSQEFDDPSLYLTGIPTSISGLTYRLWINCEMFSKDGPSLVVTDNDINVGTISINDPYLINCGIDHWNKVIQFVSNNRDVLLHFYFYSNDEDFSDVKDFYIKLKKVS